MASAQSQVTAPSHASIRSQADRVSSIFATTFYYVFMLSLGILWITIWSILAYSLAMTEGLLSGAIMGIYFVVPALAVGYFALRRRMAGTPEPGQPLAR